MQIARELGPDISRSAVLGKIHRLGIVELSPYGGTRGQRPAGKKIRGARTRGGEHHVAEERPREKRPVPTWVTDAKPFIDDPLSDTDIALPQRRSFLELSDHTCRWPVGDPSNSDFFFCGAEPLQGKPYCAAHCARAYRPKADMTPRAPSARLRRAVLKNCGIGTYIKLGGATAADRQWIGEEG